MPGAPLRSILVPVDGSAYADQALTWAIDLATTYAARLTVLSVVPLLAPAYGGIAYVPQAAVDSQSKYFHEVAERAAARARAAGIGSVTAEVREGSVAGAILGYLDDHPADLVVVGSRGLGVGGRVLLGSVSDALVHHATCPVLVVRPSTDPPATLAPARAERTHTA